MVSFSVSREESKLIRRIAKRAVHELKLPHGADLLHVEMDITACHCNGCKLQLRELVEAKGSDFAHDVHGIVANLDRETGDLKNSFCPRFSGPAKELSDSDFDALRYAHDYQHGVD